MADLDAVLLNFVHGVHRPLAEAAKDPTVPVRDILAIYDYIRTLLDASIRPALDRVGQIETTVEPVKSPLTQTPRGPESAVGPMAVETEAAKAWKEKLRSLNQKAKSKVREVEILRILGEADTVRLDDIMTRLTKAGLASIEQRAAIVTQISRLISDRGLVCRPYEGVYQITSSGSEQLRKYLRTYEDTLVPSELR